MYSIETFTQGISFMNTESYINNIKKSYTASAIHYTLLSSTLSSTLISRIGSDLLVKRKVCISTSTAIANSCKNLLLLEAKIAALNTLLLDIENFSSSVRELLAHCVQLKIEMNREIHE
jgi:hypothetical protein